MIYDVDKDNIFIEVKLLEREYGVISYIKWILKQSRKYHNDIDLNVGNIYSGKYKYFGLLMSPDYKNGSTYLTNNLDGRDKIISLEDFISSLEYYSGITKSSLVLERKELSIDGYLREFPVTVPESKNSDADKKSDPDLTPDLTPDPEEFIEDEGYEVRVYVEHGYFSYKVPTLERAIEHGQTILKSKGFRAADGVDKNRLPLYSVNKVVIIGEGAGETKYPAIFHRT